METEIRFYFNRGEKNKIIKKLNSISALKNNGLYFERTVQLDHPMKEETFYQDKIDGRFRIRLSESDTDKKLMISWKQRLQDVKRKKINLEEEIEILINPIDYDSVMKILLDVLKMKQIESYERFRNIYSNKEIEIVVDEFPFGISIELEDKSSNNDAEGNILKWVKLLGLNIDDAYELSWDDKYSELCKEQGKKYQYDLTFETECPNVNAMFSKSDTNDNKIEKIKNRNLNDVYKISLDGNSFILRNTVFNNNFEISVLKYLEKYDFNCPRVVNTFDYKNKHNILLKYIEGENPTIVNDRFCIDLANNLKKLHSIDFKSLSTIKNANEENLDKLNDYLKDAITSNYMKEEIQFIKETINEVKDLELSFLPQAIIHSDVKPSNMIVNDEKLFLIDFGNSYIGARIIDLVRTIMWLFLKDKIIKWEYIRLLINEYFSQNKILSSEVENINKIIKYCLVYNYIKDLYLYETGFLPESHILENDIKWLSILKDEDLIKKLGDEFNC